MTDTLERELADLKAQHYEEKLSCTHVILALQDQLEVMTQRAESAQQDAAGQRLWKETAYEERAKIVSLLSRIYPAWIAAHDPLDASWDSQWRTIVFVDLPTGQVSWHMHDNDVGFFAHLTQGTKSWDGHTTEEKYNRVLGVREAKEPV